MSVVQDHSGQVVFRIAGMPPNEDDLRKYGLEPDPHPPGITDPVEADAWNNLFYVLKNGSESRYCDGSFGVAYTAFQDETAIAEKGYWVKQLVFEKPDPPDRLEVLQMEFVVQGSNRSFLDLPDYDPELTHPSDYKLCQDIGKESSSQGLHFIVVPSARKQAGINVPVFSDDALPEVKAGHIKAFVSSYSYPGRQLEFTSFTGSKAVEIEEVYPDWSAGA